MLFRLKACLASFALLFATGGFAYAQTPGVAPVFLYENYAFGMKRSVVASIPFVGPCENMDPNQVLCSENAFYIGLKWSRLFFFEKEQLTSVVLYSESIQDHFDAAIKNLEERGFALVAMTNGKDKTFDLVKEAKGKSAQELKSAMEKFEDEAIASARIMYTYFDNASKPKNLGAKPGWSAWADAAPDSLQMAQVELSVPNYIRITFSAPKMQLAP